MFTGYENRADLMLDAKRDQATQTVFPCGHVLRQRAASPDEAEPRKPRETASERHREKGGR